MADLVVADIGGTSSRWALVPSTGKARVIDRLPGANVAVGRTEALVNALNDHCALEGYSRGSLTVLVDSSSHLYELKQLLLAGLQQQLLIACKGAGLRKITLKPGRWYDAGDDGDRKPRFL